MLQPFLVDQVLITPHHYDYLNLNAFGSTKYSYFYKYSFLLVFLSSFLHLVMVIASQMTAPAVAIAMSGLLSSSPTLLEFMTSASLLLDSLGFGVSSVLGVVSAGLASWKMSRRTQCLKEFYVDSLHVPNLTDTSLNDLSELKQNEHAKLGLPIYFLATGHCEKGVDFRYVWGAEGLAEDDHESRLY